MRELVRRPERRRAWRIAGCALLAVLMAESLLGTLSIDAMWRTRPWRCGASCSVP